MFYNKLTFVYLEMPKFNLTEDELVTMFDKWLFVLRNLSRLLDRPKALQDRVFDKLFEQAEIAKYSDAERRQYEESKKDYWDYYSTMKTAKRKAREEEKVETVFRLKEMGLSLNQIAQGAGLSIEEVRKLIG